MDGCDIKGSVESRFPVSINDRSDTTDQ